MSQTPLQPEATAAYLALINLLKQPIVVVSGETGMIHDANPAAEAFTGWSLNEMRAMHHSQLHPAEEAESARERLAEIVRNSTDSAEQTARNWNVLHRGGRRIPVDILSQVAIGCDGEPLVFAILSDVSKRREAEEEMRLSELKYRRLHESIMDAVATVDMDGRIVEWNPAFESMLGYSGDELLRLTHRDITPERWHHFEEKIITEQVLVRGYSTLYEKEYRRKDGTVFPVELTTYLLRDSTAPPTRMWAIIRDITDRKNREIRLEESQRRFHSLFDSSFDGVFLTRTDGSIEMANAMACQMFGMTEQEICTTARDRLFVRDERLHNALQLRSAMGRVQAELTFIRKDGTRRDGEVASMLLDDRGQAFVILRDITKRKQVERALRASEERYRTILEAALDGFAATRNGRFTEVNDAFCRMTGYSRQELLAMGIRDLEASETPEAISARLLDVKTGASARFETKHRRKDGSILDLDVSIQYRSAGEGFVAFLHDISKRKQQEEALRRSEEKFATLFRASPISITVSDLNDNDRFLEVNEAFERFTGHTRDSIIGNTHPPDLLWADAGEYAKAVAEVTANGQLNGFEFRFRRTSGEIRHGELWTRPVDFAGRSCLLAMTIDVTERKRAEAERERLQNELAHAQKMESVGRLAGGIAHDFNNLMGAILLNTGSALDELDSSDPARDSIVAIEDAAHKAVVLGRQLMAFSQNQVPQTELLDLNSVVTENQKMVRRLIGEDIKVVFIPGPTAFVKADRGQLGQVIINLAINSRDAMPQGGTFEIETFCVDLADGDARLKSPARPGSYVVLKVSDDGTGMDLETQARVFEPFFTTKPLGKGTGLGLSVVYGIITQNGGFIDLESEPGKGTQFRINLPLAADAPGAFFDADERPIVGGSETILLAEDEPDLREKIRAVLAKAGYRVFAAADGSEALQLSVETIETIDLLLTDVVMPEMSGFRLAERLLNRRGHLKVLYMTGYPDAGEDGMPLQPDLTFLPKPFTKENLLRRLRDVLDH